MQAVLLNNDTYDWHNGLAFLLALDTPMPFLLHSFALREYPMVPQGAHRGAVKRAQTVCSALCLGNTYFAWSAESGCSFALLGGLNFRRGLRAQSKLQKDFKVIPTLSKKQYAGAGGSGCFLLSPTSPFSLQEKLVMDTQPFPPCPRWDPNLCTTDIMLHSPCTWGCREVGLRWTNNCWP